MCECGYHSCIVCKDTSPCGDTLTSNSNCTDPTMIICYCCLENTLQTRSSA